MKNYDEAYWLENEEKQADDWLVPDQRGNWLANLRNLWQWDELAAEISHESQARIAFVGAIGSGKSRLFNCIRGWSVSGKPEKQQASLYQFDTNLSVESLGLFTLVDLPRQMPTPLLTGHELLIPLGDPALILYILDATVGVSADDYRWVAALRSAGKPLLIALNKIDLVAADSDEAITNAIQRLGMSILPISAHTGENVEEQLLPAMVDAAPHLVVPLGREIPYLRPFVSRRIIRQSALLAGIMGVQPLPIVDLPIQTMIQVGVVMRIGAVYGQMPTGGMNREITGTVLSTLGMRYLALSLLKVIPVVGWAINGVLNILMTILLGETAVGYYESDRRIPLRQHLKTRQEYRQIIRHWWHVWWQRQWQKVHWLRTKKRITAVKKEQPSEA